MRLDSVPGHSADYGSATVDAIVGALWPEAFDGLSDEERSRVRNVLGSMLHEGWSPSEDGVALVCARARTELSHQQLLDLTVGVRPALVV